MPFYHLSRCQSGMFFLILGRQRGCVRESRLKKNTGFAAEQAVKRRCFEEASGWIRQSSFKAPVWKSADWGYFLFYINGKKISDQELMPAMTNYASVLGCETTYPVWEERSAHRCRYLSFDLLPYLKAGEKTYLQYDWAMAGIIRQSGLPKENLFSVCRSFGLS